MGDSGHDVVFTDDVVKGLPEDPRVAILRVCELALSDRNVRAVMGGKGGGDTAVQAVLAPAHQLIGILIARHGLDLPLQKPDSFIEEADHEASERADESVRPFALAQCFVANLGQVRDEVRRSLTEDGMIGAAAASRERFAALLLAKESPYADRPDVRRIQDRLAKLREDVREAEDLGEKHRSRVMARVDAVQYELDQPVSRFDRLLGGIVRIGTALGTAGEKAKPLLHRWREIWDVVSAAEAQAIGWVGRKLPQLMLPEAEDTSSPEDPAPDE